MSIQTLIQYFEVPLAAITASSFFVYDSTSLAHLYLGSFSHPFLQILSSSVRLDGERCYTAIFRSLQRCSIEFKSGLWLGHSRISRDLSRSHSCVVLAMCLGSLSCWTFAQVWDLSALEHQGSFCTLLLSSFPWSWLVFQSLPLKNIPTAWCCHHRASPQSCLGALRTIPSTSWFGFCSDMHCQLWDLI